MAATVVSLSDQRQQPVPEVVAAAEELLELAKSGEVRGVGIATAFANNTTSCRLEGQNNSHALMAAIADLFYRTAAMRLQVTIESGERPGPA